MARFAAYPPRPEVEARGCNGGCSICRQCMKCRNSRCYGGQWQGLGCTRCIKCTKCRSSWNDADWAAYERKLNSRRLDSVGDLPAPPRPDDGLDKRTCQFCHTRFETAHKQYLHTKTCTRMPLNMWLARIRVVQHHLLQHHVGPVFDCEHCGISFGDKRGCARHAHGCAARHRTAGARLKTGQNSSVFADALLPARYDQE